MRSVEIVQRKLPFLTVWVLYIILSRCTEKTASDKSTPPTPTTQRKKSELRHYASRKQKDSQDYSRNMASADSTAFQNQHCPGGQAMTTLWRRPSTALHCCCETKQSIITRRSAGHLPVSDYEDDYKIYAKALKMLLQSVPKEARSATREQTANLNMVS